MSTSVDQHRPADAVARHWVERAPAALRPYLRLARLDRPIGTWLLLWPCWWSIALAAPVAGGRWPDAKLMALFAIGAVAMRGAGCTFNDIVDRDIDAKVARTAARPLPSGALSVKAAWAFLVAQALTGLCVLLTLNNAARLLGVASLAIVAVYPFMKRFTHWPQAVLGLAFNWGALMGYGAVTGTLGLAPLLLYLAGIAWTLGYDTIYAHQDKADDAVIGVKSTALKLGGASAHWLKGFYGAALLFFVLAGAAGELGWGYFLLLALPAAHFIWQIQSFDGNDAARCLKLFRANRDCGALVFLALLAGTL